MSTEMSLRSCFREFSRRFKVALVTLSPLEDTPAPVNDTPTTLHYQLPQPQGALIVVAHVPARLSDRFNHPALLTGLIDLRAQPASEQCDNEQHRWQAEPEPATIRFRRCRTRLCEGHEALYRGAPWPMRIMKLSLNTKSVMQNTKTLMSKAVYACPVGTLCL